MENKRRKILKPIEPRESWHERLANEIYKAFKGGIYDDLFDIVDGARLNAADGKPYGLESAIKQGKIRYSDGKFRGEMSSTVSKELRELGATFDARSKAWSIGVGQLPQPIQAAISESTRSALLLKKILIDQLAYAQEKVIKILKVSDLDRIAKSTMAKTDKEFKETVVKEMAVQPKLSTGARIFFDEEYVKSMTRPIKPIVEKANRENVEGSAELFAQEETKRLREEIEKWVLSGKSRTGLRDMLEARLGVSRDRATFIARQETALVTSTYKQAQYMNAGIKKYIWRAVMDDRTRHDHEILDGDEFSWDNPPVINLKTQVRGHPGFDWQCRCVAEPIVEL